MAAFRRARAEEPQFQQGTTCQPCFTVVPDNIDGDVFFIFSLLNVLPFDLCIMFCCLCESSVLPSSGFSLLGTALLICTLVSFAPTSRPSNNELHFFFPFASPADNRSSRLSASFFLPVFFLATGLFASALAASASCCFFISAFLATLACSAALSFAFLFSGSPPYEKIM